MNTKIFNNTYHFGIVQLKNVTCDTLYAQYYMNIIIIIDWGCGKPGIFLCRYENKGKAWSRPSLDDGLHIVNCFSSERVEVSYMNTMAHYCRAKSVTMSKLEVDRPNNIAQ